MITELALEVFTADGIKSRALVPNHARLEFKCLMTELGIGSALIKQQPLGNWGCTHQLPLQSESNATEFVAGIILLHLAPSCLLLFQVMLGPRYGFNIIRSAVLWCRSLTLSCCMVRTFLPSWRSRIIIVLTWSFMVHTLPQKSPSSRGMFKLEL